MKRKRILKRPDGAKLLFALLILILITFLFIQVIKLKNSGEIEDKQFAPYSYGEKEIR